jgi:hypothetical protein
VEHRKQQGKHHNVKPLPRTMSNDKLHKVP